MKSITIHGLDDPLDSLIRQRAKRKGTSLNKTIKKLLEESLGVRPVTDRGHREDFLDLFGVWSDADLRDFERSTRDLAKIDPEDWE